MNRALGKLTDDLKQALDDAQVTNTKQLEHFMKDQTEELKTTVQDSAAKGTQEVLEKLDVIHEEVSKCLTATQSVSIIDNRF